MEKDDYISLLDSFIISVSKYLIKCQQIFGIIIFYLTKGCQFSVQGTFIQRRSGNLVIGDAARSAGDKVHLTTIIKLPYGGIITSPKQFQINDILKDMADITVFDTMSFNNTVL